MSRYAAGRRAEWKVVRAMKALGGLVTRSAGSKGLWDVTSVFPPGKEDSIGAVWLIQVKVTKKGSWKDANWRSLCALKLPPNVTACAFVFRRGRSFPAFHEAVAAQS